MVITSSHHTMNNKTRNSGIKVTAATMCHRACAKDHEFQCHHSSTSQISAYVTIKRYHRPLSRLWVLKHESSLASNDTFSMPIFVKIQSVAY